MTENKQKTKIVCTIGPASDSIEKMVGLIESGMSIARLNYSHGNFEKHAEVIKMLRKASEITGISIAILADLPGPKMRIGKIEPEQIQLIQGQTVCLTTDNIIGNENKFSVSFAKLPKVVKPGNTLFLNDGIIQLSVTEIKENEVICQVIVGGELRSNKGLNLPGINLGISAFTENDYLCLESALKNGVDAISQSFVNNAEDIIDVRAAATKLGYNPFIIAKIERADALTNLDQILNYTDGLMIARGDLGVEIPIEKIALVQKHIINTANLHGKPVITATQLLGSMTTNPRPTRAEVTDVSNAIIDGTDCVMLSEESAMGKYPLESVQMLSKIALTVENSRINNTSRRRQENLYRNDGSHVSDTISYNVQQSVYHLKALCVAVHTITGHIARMISRFKLPVWINAMTEDVSVYQSLHFSFGIHPILVSQLPESWNQYIKETISPNHEDNSSIVILVEGPTKNAPLSSHKMEIIDLLNPT